MGLRQALKDHRPDLLPLFPVVVSSDKHNASQYLAGLKAISEALGVEFDPTANPVVTAKALKDILTP